MAQNLSGACRAGVVADRAETASTHAVSVQTRSVVDWSRSATHDVYSDLIFLSCNIKHRASDSCDGTEPICCGGTEPSQPCTQ